MTAVPPVTPVTTPVPVTDATPAAVLDHVPPDEVSDKVTLVPWQNDEVPVIGPTTAAAPTVTV